MQNFRVGTERAHLSFATLKIRRLAKNLMARKENEKFTLDIGEQEK